MLVTFLLALGISIMSATPSAAGEDSAGGLQVIDQSPTTRVGEFFDLVLQLPGVVTKGDQMTVTIHEPVTDEPQFVASSRGEDLGGVLASQRFDLTDLQPDVWGLTTISLLITDTGVEGIRLVQPGVYPISVEMRTANQELVGKLVTHLIRVDERISGELPIVFVADLRNFSPAPNSSSRSVDAWLSVLGSYPSIPVGVTFHPVSVNENLFSSIISSFVKTKHEIIRSPYTPINEADLVDAGLTEEVASLARMGAESLGTIGHLAPPTLWVGHGEADVSQADVRWDRGIRELIVESVSLSPVPEKNPRGPVELLSNKSTFRGLVVDVLSQRQAHDTPASEAQRILSHLATIALTEQSNSLVTIDLGRDNRSPEFADLLLRGLSTLDWLAPLPASEAVTKSLLQSDGLPRQHRLRSRVSSTKHDFGDYREAVRHLNAIRSMTRDEDAQQYDDLSEELLLSLSSEVSALTQKDLWQSTVDLIRLQASLVDIPPDESIQLTSQKASVPFSFQNRAGIPLRVELRIISERLTVEDFDDGESTTLVLEPGVTTHRFRLRALGSGSFPVSIELHSPDGELLVGRAQAALRATTPTGVGLGLTIGAAVFLASWWLLDSRRRKSRRL
jgi:hypothetical protein